MIAPLPASRMNTLNFLAEDMITLSVQLVSTLSLKDLPLGREVLMQGLILSDCSTIIMALALKALRGGNWKGPAKYPAVIHETIVLERIWP